MSTGFEKSFRLRKFVLFYAGVAQEQVIRPLHTRLDQQLVALAMEATNFGQNITSGAFRPIASSIIQPKAQHEGLSIVENGWGTPRLSFLMEIEVINNYTGMTNVMAFSGYTDHVGTIQRNGNDMLDPQMRLYFNNCVRLATIQTPTPHGVANRMVSRVAEQILRPTVVPNYTPGGNSEYTMRPVDVMTVGGSASIMQSSGLRVDNYAPSFNSGPKLANRNDMLGASYLARSVSSYTAANAEVDDGYTHADVASIASGNLNNNLMESNDFLRSLGNRFDFNDPAFGGSITMSELCQLDPNADHIAQVIIPPVPQRQQQQTMVANSCGWGGSDNETIAANIICQAVPTIMCRFMLGRLSFTVTNDTITGEPSIEWNNLQGFTDGLDVRPFIGAIAEYILTEILAPISFQGQTIASISVDSYLYASTDIVVSIGGAPAVVFNSPTFADQLFSPFIAHQYDTVLNMGADIVNLSDEIGTAQFRPNFTGGSNGIVTGI